MKLDKAIKNLTAGREDCGMIPEEEFTPTLDLAVEAMKRVQESRKKVYFTTRSLLPGETEE